MSAPSGGAPDSQGLAGQRDDVIAALGRLNDSASGRCDVCGAGRFLRWSATDTGPIRTRPGRYEQHLDHDDPDHLADARAGLMWWADHRHIIALTQPAHR